MVAKWYRYRFEKIKNKNSPPGNAKAVYLLSKANPIQIPAQIQNQRFFSKMAMYKVSKLNAQKNSNGTSGVVTTDRLEISMVEESNTQVMYLRSLRMIFDAKVKKANWVPRVMMKSANLTANTVLPKIRLKR